MSSGCKKKSLISFNIQISQQFTIQSTNPIQLPFSILIPDVQTNSNAEFEKNDSRVEYVKEIKLNEFRLQIESPIDQSFDFLKEIEIFIASEGLDEIRLASKFDINNNARTLDLDCETNDFSAYLKKESFKLRVRTVLRKTINKDIKILSNQNFRVKAGLKD
jgi:hypothetical protein